MKVDFRTFTSFGFSLEMDPEETILDAKAKIRDMRKFETEDLQFIYGSQILNDTDKIKDLDMTTNSFIVLHHLKRPKLVPMDPEVPINPPVVEAPTPPPEQEAPVPQIPIDPTLLEESPEVPQTKSKHRKDDIYTFADPPNFNQLVANLMEMGLPEDDCKHALRAYNFDIERAANYLFSNMQ